MLICVFVSDSSLMRRGVGCYAGEMQDSIKVTDVKSLCGGMMLVTFSTGEIRLFDTTTLQGSAFKPLADGKIFMNPVLFHGAITWNNGEIDIALEAVHQGSSSVDFSYSAIETSQFNDFITSFNVFCNDATALLMAKSDEIRLARDEMTRTDYAYPEFVDLKGVIDSFGDIGLESSGLEKQLDRLVLSSATTGEFEGDTCGVGINFPHTSEERGYYCKEGSDYKILNFYADSNWDEFLIEFWKCL